MALVVKDKSEGKFPRLPLPEAGTVQAVCCGVWDLGLQRTTYAGQEKIQHKVIIAWEIAELIDEPESDYHGMPYMLNRKYTFSLNEKAHLRKDLESWRGRPFTAEQLAEGFDLETLYGVNCLLGITHVPDRNDPSREYANVTALLPLPKGMEKIEPVRGANDDPPVWVQNKQAEAVEPDNVPAVNGKVNGVPPSPDEDDFPW